MDQAARRLEAVTVIAGQTVVTEGDPADRFYIIDRGRFIVSQQKGPEERVLREMGPGDVFGEIGLLTGARRSATVRAVEDARLLALDGPAFLELVSSGPGLTTRLLDLHRGATASSSG